MAKTKSRLKTKTKKAKALTNINLKEQSLSQLKDLLDQTKAEWVKLSMDLKVAKLKDVHEPLKTRRQIARIKTLIRKKELEKENEAI
jgi:ribosomal protein L29